MLLEREGELALLRRVTGDAPVAGGKVVLVRGEAGIGKSSLVRTFAAEQAERGPVYLGTCDPLLIPRALDPLWDIARDVPMLWEPLDRADRTGVLEVILRMLTDARGPSALIIEDTHWADEATLDAIRYVGRRIARTSGVLLLTYRDGEVDADHPLRGVIGDIPVGDVVRVHLDGLSLQGVARMVGATRLDPRTVLGATRGNPLLVAETVAATAGGGATSLGDAVVARVQRLTPGAQDAIRTLCIVPEPITRAEALGIAGVDDARLDECEARGLLDTSNGYVMFRHALIRDTIYAALSAGERRTRATVLLRDLPEDTHPCLIVVCAWTAQDADRLVRAVPHSARYGMAMGSHVQARDDWRALGPHMDRVPREARGGYLEDWAREESIAGSADEAIRIADLAREHYRAAGSATDESRVLAQAARYLEYAARRAEAEDRAREAVEVLGPDPDGPALARALEAVTYLRMMVGDVDAVPALVDRTLAASGDRIDPVVRIRSLNHRGMAANMRAYPSGQASLEMALAEAEAAGQWYEASRALLNQAWAANEHLDATAASDFAQRSMAVAARHEVLSLESAARVQYAKSLELQGAWDDALDQIRERLDPAPIHLMVALPIEASIETRRGRTSAAATLDTAWRLARSAREFQRSAPAAIAQLEHAWIAGGDVFLVGELEAVAREGLSQGMRWSPGRICFWLWLLGVGSGPLPGIAEPYRLVIAGDVTSAAAILEERGAPYERAMVLAQGDAAQRQEALDILEGLGAVAAAARLRQVLRERGIAVTRGRGRATRSHAAGLTARQAEVLELLREGLTDQQISDRLFISQRTAEHHVSAVLDKLDVTSRDEAVERAIADGLLPTL